MQSVKQWLPDLTSQHIQKGKRKKKAPTRVDACKIWL